MVTEQPGTLTLHVSNQSLADDPVGITVSIDDEVVVDEEFSVGAQDAWSTLELAVAAGDHELVMTSSTGVTDTAALCIPADGHRWVVVGYWFDAKPRRFTFTVADEPVSFA